MAGLLWVCFVTGGDHARRGQVNDGEHRRTFSKKNRPENRKRPISARRREIPAWSEQAGNRSGRRRSRRSVAALSSPMTTLVLLPRTFPGYLRAAERMTPAR